MIGQTPEQARSGGRIETTFWTWEDDVAMRDAYDVVRVQAFDGPSTDRDAYWWVPSLGKSMQEGRYLFVSRDEAIRKATAELDARITRLQQLRAKLPGAPTFTEGS